MKKFIITESEKKNILSQYNIITESIGTPKTYNEIKKFQNWVLNVAKNKTILGTSGADGKWGPNTGTAWSLYGGQYSLSPKNFGNNASKPKVDVFPFNKLNNNPTSKFIAYIIKKSDGGFTGNDNEAYAEAAFNSIKTPQKYSEVAKYLGEDPYEFISGFMDTKTRYHLNPVYTHYLELYKSNPEDRPKVSKPNNVKDFQLWVLNTKKDKKILGRYGADGDWGPSSIKAWYKYGVEYLKTDRNDNLEDNLEDKFDGFAIPFAFPDYEPTVDGTGFWDKFLGQVSSLINGAEKSNTYGKIGHAGVSLVTKSGNVITYEFGRYTSKSLGIKVSKSLGKIAKIVNGEITNLENVINIIHRNTQGDGPKETIEYVVLKTPNVTNGIQYANSVAQKDYSAFDFSITDSDANCATFAIEVVKSCGIDAPSVCLNTPHKMIEEMRLIKDIQDKNYGGVLAKSGVSGLKTASLVNPALLPLGKLTQY